MYKYDMISIEYNINKEYICLHYNIGYIKQ